MSSHPTRRLRPSLTADKPTPILIRASSAREFLATIPYLIGFTPHESLVFTGMRGNRVGPTARLDLEVALENPGYCASVVSRLFDSQDVDSTQVIVYSDDDPVPGLGKIPVVLGLHGLSVTSILQVSSQHYWDHDNPTARRSVEDLDDTVARAELVAAGHAPARSRESLARNLAPYPATVRRQIARVARWNEADLALGLLGEVDQQAALPRLASALGDPGSAPLRCPRSADPPRPLTDADSALLLAAINNGRLRDVTTYAVLMNVPISAAWEHLRDSEDTSYLSRIMLEPGAAPRPNEERLDVARELLRHLVRCGTGVLVARPLALLAQLYWWSGCGGQANIVTELAIQADENATMAAVMNSLLQAGVAPPWVSDDFTRNDPFAGGPHRILPAEEGIGFGEYGASQPG